MNPLQTVGDTLTGIGSMFGSFHSGMINAGKTQDGALAGLMGVTREKRLIAHRLGVDPYTDFEPLNVKLTQLSEAAAMGGLSVTGALLVIPGAAGIVVSNLSTANRLGDIKIDELARDYSAAQIMDLNRQRLIAMGVERNLVEVALANRNFTPIDMAAMVAALDIMTAVQDRSIFFARAAAVDNRPIAYFMRRQAEMLADHYRRTGAFTRFVSLGGYPFNLARDGRIIGIMPIDALSWMPSTAKAFGDSTADMRRAVPGIRAELRIAGRATGIARQQLKALGWSVVENVKF